jgi:hypothetical protein
MGEVSRSAAEPVTASVPCVGANARASTSADGAGLLPLIGMSGRPTGQNDTAAVSRRWAQGSQQGATPPRRPSRPPQVPVSRPGPATGPRCVATRATARGAGRARRSPSSGGLPSDPRHGVAPRWVQARLMEERRGCARGRGRVHLGGASLRPCQTLSNKCSICLVVAEQVIACQADHRLGLISMPSQLWPTSGDATLEAGARRSPRTRGR